MVNGLVGSATVRVPLDMPVVPVGAIAPTGTTGMSSGTLTVADPTSPLTIGVDVSTYSATSGTVSYSGDPSGNAVVTDSSGDPVILHFERG